MSAIDLTACCARIGYSGLRAPTLETLREILALHPQAIPFENLDPFLGHPVELEVETRELTNDVGGKSVGYRRRQGPLLPPVFSSRRIDPMVIPRSIAFTMS